MDLWNQTSHTALAWLKDRFVEEFPGLVGGGVVEVAWPVEAIAPRATLTERARVWAYEQVGAADAAVSVLLGVAWWTVMRQVIDCDTGEVDDPARLDNVAAVGGPAPFAVTVIFGRVVVACSSGVSLGLDQLPSASQVSPDQEAISFIQAPTHRSAEEPGFT